MTPEGVPAVGSGVALSTRIGPQLKGEGVLAARVRLHQSWYRSEYLGLRAWGATPAPHRRPLGSILTAHDAASGHAFVCPEARELFRARRREGWGVDPVRIQGYLTSSQGLTVNLFGVLAVDACWSAAVLSSVLGLGVKRVLEVRLEYAPHRPSEFLGDKTRMDALLVLQREDGTRLPLSVEIKLADRWSSRGVVISGHRYKTAAKSLGQWRQPSAAFENRALNQLVRSHMLAGLVARADGIYEPAHVLVISVDRDEKSRAVVAAYRSELTDAGHLTHVTLEQLFTAMRDAAITPRHEALAEKMRRRYVAFELSERAWMQCGERGKARNA